MRAIVRYLDKNDINNIKKESFGCDIKSYIDFNIDDIDDGGFYIGIFKYGYEFIGLCTIGSVIGINDYKNNIEDCIMSNVFIIPKYRKKGYGTYLVKEALLLAKQQYGNVYCHIDILDQTLLSFYKHIGFKIESYDNNGFTSMKIDISKIHDNKTDTEWSFISKYMKVSEDFIERYSDKIDWYILTKYHKLPESIIEKYLDKIDWDNISETSTLSEDFIDKYFDKVNWNNIYMYQKLSEDFIENHLDKIDWKYVSWNQTLSEDFIIKYKDKVHWPSISATKNLSTNFIKEFFDYIDWNAFFYFRCREYCYSFINNIKDFIDDDKLQILKEKIHLCNGGIPTYITVNLDP